MARPECAGLLSRSGYVRSGLPGSWSLRHKGPLHILLYPGHCGDAASTHNSCGGSTAKCSSCHWVAPVPVQLLGGHSGAGPGLHSSLSKGSGDFHSFISSPATGCRWYLSVTCVNVAFRMLPSPSQDSALFPPVKDFCTQYLC